MKYILKSIITSFIIISAVFSETSAQNNIIFGMHKVPQTININPAKQPTCGFYLTLPVVPGIYTDFNNSSLTLSTIFKARADRPDSFIINQDAVTQAIKEKNYINLEANITLLSLGFKIANGYYFNFAVSNRTTQNFIYPNLMEITKGNFRQDSTPIPLHFYENITNYNEYSFGLSKQLFNNFSVGGKVKILSGIANINTEKFNFDWYTETSADSMYEWTFDTDLNIQTASILDWNLSIDSTGVNTNIEDAINNIDPTKAIFTGNLGLAFDLGVQYNLKDKLILSASVVDLGFINWKTNPEILTQKGTFRFSGIDLAQYFNSLDAFQDGSQSISDQIITDFTDSLFNFIDLEITQEAYRTNLNTKLYAGANYFVTKWLDFGLLYRGQFYNKQLFSSYTVSANTNFMKGWSFSAGYSIMDNLYNNIGLGLAYKLGPFQMYFLSDNIAAPFWALNESELSDNWIRNTKRINFQFGINIVSCRNKEDKGLIE